MNTEYISKEEALDFIRQAYMVYLPHAHGAVAFIENGITNMKPKNVVLREEQTLKQPHEYYIEPGHTRLGVDYKDGRPRFIVQVGAFDCRKCKDLPAGEHKLPVFGMTFHDLDQFKIFADNLEMAVNALMTYEEKGRTT